MNTRPPIKIVIADDYEIFREGFKVLLKNQDEVELVGEAENGKEILEVINSKKPEIAFLDIQMPIMDGIESCRIISGKFPETQVIAISMFNNDHYIIDMLEAGARGYIHKNTRKEELLHAARAVHDGYTYYCNETSEKLKRMIAESKFNPYKKKAEITFTDQELKVIQLICEQYSSKEIGDKLDLSVRTVETYKMKIQEKLDTRNMVGIAVYAYKHKLFEKW